MKTSSKEDIGLLGEIAEMRRIYTAVENAVEDPGAMCIAVSSASINEGKTMVSAGLASCASSREGKRVLAMDLNWFRPALHACFGLQQNFELGDIGNGKSALDMAQPSEIDNLTILSAPGLNGAPPAHSETWNPLGNGMIKRLRKDYDVVIIDTSPVFPLNRHKVDPVTLSKMVDGVVLVAMVNETPRQEIMRARMVLETSGANVLGVVLNQRGA